MEQQAFLPAPNTLNDWRRISPH